MLNAYFPKKTGDFEVLFYITSIPETNMDIAPKNQWLEDKFPFWRGKTPSFHGQTVREGKSKNQAHPRFCREPSLPPTDIDS